MLSFSPPFPPQGLFFDDSYGFYPGQVLIGPSKVFSSVQWLSGVKPVLSTKSKFRVVVEEVRTDKLTHMATFCTEWSLAGILEQSQLAMVTFQEQTHCGCGVLR